jgi:ribonuclease-3
MDDGYEGDVDVELLEARLHYVFSDRSLLERALSHSSHANESPDGESNERLEFLGDAVIGLVVAHLLFEANPDWREGDLTRGLHSLVDRRSLAEQAKALDLGTHLRLGRTERQSRGHEKESILADAMEALLGAIYIDGGLEPVTVLARALFADSLEGDSPGVERDPKTRFQESIMAEFGYFPSYELEGDSGVEGDDARFHVRVLVGDESWGSGVGRTKRAAERIAAECGLERMDARERDGEGT